MQILLLLIILSQQGTGSIKGEIKDRGEPLGGVDVALLELDLATYTDMEGKFSFNNVPVGEYTLRIDYMGYEPLEIPVFVNYSGEIVELKFGDKEGGFSHLSKIPSTDPYKLLNKNGFVIVPSGELDFFELYNNIVENDEPILLTTDIIFHTTHQFFDYLLRIIEYFKFYPLTESLTKEMVYKLLESSSKYSANKYTYIAFKKNIAYFSVGAKILDPDFKTPQIVQDLVSDELSLINTARSISASPIFGREFDYSQFKPRGHYMVNRKFMDYFKAMMWFGSMRFLLDDQEDILQVVIIVKVLDENPDMFRKWEKVFNIVTLLVGKTDDINFYQLLPIVKNVFGADITIDAKNIKEKSKECIRECVNLPWPKILSAPSRVTEPKNFRFLGQRFITDSYFFQQLVWPSVGRYEGKGEPFTYGIVLEGPVPSRVFPRALDIFLIFGDGEAEKILEEDGDTEYEGYWGKVQKLKEEISGWKCESIYDKYLFMLKDFLEEEYKTSPPFMRKKPWQHKKLNTTLGFWTELRHDIMLYAKMSAVGYGIKFPKEITAYVEPYPLLYDNLKVLLLETENILKREGILLNGVESNFENFANFLERTEEISNKELKDKMISKENQKFIKNSSKMLLSFRSFPDEYLKKVRTGIKEKTPIVIDVHTDYNSGQVLEEGVGCPDFIYVKFKIDGHEVVLKGGVFSYYEFKQALSKRLTDEQWRLMLFTNPPPRPLWMREYITLIVPGF